MVCNATTTALYVLFLLLLLPVQFVVGFVRGNRSNAIHALGFENINTKEENKNWTKY